MFHSSICLFQCLLLRNKYTFYYQVTYFIRLPICAHNLTFPKINLNQRQIFIFFPTFFVYVLTFLGNIEKATETTTKTEPINVWVILYT